MLFERVEIGRVVAFESSLRDLSYIQDEAFAQTRYGANLMIQSVVGLSPSWRLRGKTPKVYGSDSEPLYRSFLSKPFISAME